MAWHSLHHRRGSRHAVHRGHRHSRGSDAPTYTFGNAIAFASGVAYGLYLFFSRYREDCDSNVRSWWNFLFASLAILVLLLWHNFCLQPLSYTEKVNGVTQVDAAGQIITHPWNLFTMPLDSWLWLSSPASARSICSPMPPSA